MTTIMADAPVADTRQPLPRRPIPHERIPDRPTPSGTRPHPQNLAADPMLTEALRRVVELEIGPREVGALYRNVDGVFEVLAVIRDPERARALLKRRSAQWALIVKDVTRAGGEPFAIGSVWTTSDYLVREAGARRVEAFA
ncbi:hypothetical protein ACFYZI_40845 [Streptomyces griseorubiginosus]|uniref:hypothetical protein n=1 Tax=Streptomyces griseorubiginosus TaxID=67304 RepID=UPI0036C44D28